MRCFVRNIEEGQESGSRRLQGRVKGQEFAPLPVRGSPADHPYRGC